MNKRILIVAATLAGGGAERVFVNLANEMSKNGIKVSILVTAENKTDFIPNSNVEIITINTNYKHKLYKIFKKLIQIRKVFKCFDNSTIISYMPDTSIYTAVASIGLKNKVIMSERSAPMCNPDQRYKRVLRNLSYRFADVCVFQTDGARSFFPKSIQKKGVIILNPIDIELINEHKEIEKTILLIGRLVPSKNLKMFIDAFKLLVEIHPEFSAKILGRGREEENLKNYTIKLGLEQHISFCGFSSSVYDELKKSMMYVSTSNYEGLSNTMIEAMALGVPTIVTDCPSGGARMLINHGENGLLVPVNDRASLFDMMLEVIENETLRNNLSKNSVSVINLVNMKKICGEWERII